MRRHVLVVLALAMTIPVFARAQASCSKPVDACAFVDTFLSALNRQDWPAFRRTLDDSISVFLENPAPVQRLDGRPAAESLFVNIFTPPADRSSPLPPAFVPEHLRAQDFGSVVVVTFELRRPQALSRRTLVLSRGPTGWHVVHIHGSARPSPEG